MPDVAANPVTEAEGTPLLACFLPQLSAGGAERVILAIAGEAARRGYRCDLVTAQAGGRWEGNVPTGVRTICLDRRKPLHAIPRLVAYLRRERPAALLSSVFSANVAAVAACQVSRTRCVLREAFWAEQDALSGGRLSRAVNTLALRVLYRRADAIIALTNELAAHIREATGMPAGRITVIPNPHLPLTENASSRREPDLILACGRLEPQKDFDTLLQAFALLSRERTARLVILGEGSQRRHLEQRAADLGIAHAVRLEGYSGQVDAWMRRAKVFVSTSRSEGFPNVLLEALAGGCEVVSTLSTDAVRDVLGDAGGRLVEVGNATAIAAALSDAMDAETDAVPALHRIQARFDLQTIVDRYLHVLLPSPQGVNA